MDDHFILEIEDAIPREVCEEMIKRLEKSPHKKPDIILDPVNNTYIVDTKRRDSVSVFISNKNEWSDIDSILSKSITDGLKIYEREIKKKIEMIGEDPDYLFGLFFRGGTFTDSGYSVVRVNPNTWYRWHHDGGIDTEVLRCIWYLNDMSEEEGGRTMFINRRNIKPQAGKLAFFPATWIHAHAGEKVTTNKYICCSSLSIGK